MAGGLTNSYHLEAVVLLSGFVFFYLKNVLGVDRSNPRVCIIAAADLLQSLVQFGRGEGDKFGESGYLARILGGLQLPQLRLHLLQAAGGRRRRRRATRRRSCCCYCCCCCSCCCCCCCPAASAPVSSIVVVVRLPHGSGRCLWNRRRTRRGRRRIGHASSAVRLILGV